MSNLTDQTKIFDFSIPTVIVGMGKTGLSCARFLDKKGCPFAFADSRQDPPLFNEVKKEFPDVDILTGEFEINKFKTYQQFIVSPGMSIRNKFFKTLQEHGCLIIGDIEIFAQVVDKPVIAITGSNGKSTVTTLVEKIANDCGIKTIAGGNLGIPALDLLGTQSDLYVLELSSFQLETTYSLRSLSATVLNVSEDHMDRYIGFEDYRKVKESIYHNCENKIVNRDERKTFATICASGNNEAQDNDVILFGSDEPKKNEYGLVKENHLFTLKKGGHSIMQSTDIKLKGLYNYTNILAALALLEPLHLDEKKEVAAIKEYSGLPHRCEWVDEINGVQFYNDSKGTNTGATIAAINGFDSFCCNHVGTNIIAEGSNTNAEGSTSKRTTILIAGGVGKDADFTELGQVIEKKIKCTVLMGIDSDSIKACALNAGAKNDSLFCVNSMQEAVLTASNQAETGDVVLFSPACASFDMYLNYMKRGNDFKEKVLALKEGLKDAC